MPLGVTLMSAGSRTEPGGYTGQGKESLHLTVKGRIADSISTTNGSNGGLANRAGAKAECQFEVEDHRSPEEIVRALRAHDLEPVWKDWDAAFLVV
jgi:2-iminoacetate synthase